MTFMSIGDFNSFIESLDPDPQIRGKQFEKTVKWWVQNDPIHSREYKKVWLWDEWPDRNGPDIGIDLVAVKHDNTWCAIQAKCFASDRAIPKSEIDSFISAASPRKFAHRMLVSTTDGLSSNARKALRDNHITLILGSYLESLTLFWPETFSSLGAPRTISKYVPRAHQARAINDVLTGLRSASRGQLIMACGTGKTLTALWIAECLESSCTLVLVPSLSLLSQVLSEWATQASSQWAYLCVCSDSTVNKSDDAPILTVDELPFEVTTKPADIAKFLKLRGRKIVFSTYQSSAQISKAQKLSNKKFDLIIADEAHRLTGKNDAEFATVLDPKKILSKKLLFMTATPRTYTTAVKQMASERGVEMSSMDDDKVFGKELHKLSFGQAIENDLLTDYRVVIVGVLDREVLEVIERRELVSVGGTVETDARTLAAHIGLAKAVKDYGLKKTISFHGRIKSAVAFAQDFPKIVEWLPDDHKPSGTFWAGTITGAMNSSSRRKLLDKLKENVAGRHALLSNARCLTEGIDVPSLDGVAFIDPRSSQVEIIQAVGRAIRNSDNKSLGTIVLPVLISSEVDPEEAVSNSAFNAIWSIIKALRSHDESLSNALDELRLRLGRTKSGVPRLPPKIVLDLPRQIDTLSIKFLSTLSLMIIENTTQSWDEWYGVLLAFVDENNHCQIKQADKYRGYALGRWVTKQRSAYRSKLRTLASHRIEKLELLPGWTWEPISAYWSQMCNLLVAYVEEHGHCRLSQSEIYRNVLLGAWVSRLRFSYRGIPGALENYKIKKLESIPGWTWEPISDSWNQMFDAVFDYAKQHGSTKIPNHIKWAKISLRSWVKTQRQAYFGTNPNLANLDKEKIDKLESITGWTWDPISGFWNQMFVAVSDYAKQHGNTKISSYATGFDRQLDTWIRNQRLSFYGKKGKRLDKDRVKQLESILGWSWDPESANWDQMFEAVFNYAKQHGSTIISGDSSRLSSSLSYWIKKQRTDYHRKNSVLDKKRIKQLESIQGWSWDPHAENWTEMYECLVKYQIQHKSIDRIPRTLQGPNGSIAGWVYRQRVVYKRAPHSFEKHKLRKLEEIPGWSWLN